MKYGDINISAEIICASVSPAGKKIVTYLLRYPRFIHSELMTHRMLSKNAMSSRAVPTKVQRERIENHPAHPEEWGANNPGMQSKLLLDEETRKEAELLWDEASQSMLEIASTMSDHLNVHKQISNRLLEPFTTMECIVTGTEWDNFFALRAHEDAQPEFQVLAYRMLAAFLNEDYKTNDQNGGWHIPFGDQMPEGLELADKLKVAVARCARLSYVNHGGDHSIEKDIKLHDILLNAGHMSPFEHIARYIDDPLEVSGNLIGWHQYRKDLPNECRQAVDLQALLDAKPDHISIDTF